MIRKSDPLAQAVVLFSDVGDFYKRCGFDRCKEVAEDVIFPSLADQGEPVAELITEENFKSEFESAMREVRRVDSPFVIFPLAEKLDWLRCNETFALRHHPPPIHRGAKSRGAWAFWELSSEDDVLEVMVLSGDPSGFGDVIQEARRCASRSGFSEVRLWRDETFDQHSAPSTTTMTAKTEVTWITRNSGKVVPRERGHVAVPMLFPFIPGLNSCHLKFVPHILHL